MQKADDATTRALSLPGTGRPHVTEASQWASFPTHGLNQSGKEEKFLKKVEMAFTLAFIALLSYLIRCFARVFPFLFLLRLGPERHLMDFRP